MTNINNDQRKAIEAFIEANQWQPIETAPKDGSHILVYPALSECPLIVSWQGNMFGTGYWRIPMGDESTPYEPTHWKPLPSAPDTSTHFDTEKLMEAFDKCVEALTILQERTGYQDEWLLDSLLLAAPFMKDRG